jgi:HPt (histidine-containing phosphotransfer) domain-containing protein
MSQAAALTGQDTVLDRAHLTRMTFGDRSLEREVLELFARQAVLLVERMRSGNAMAIAALAHTLKGSAANIGAGSVAKNALATEQAANGPDVECGQAIDRLALAVDEARALISDLLRQM